MLFHVHVYKVMGKAEVNMTCDNVEEAEREALKAAEAETVSFGESDCRFIAMGFEMGCGSKKNKKTS